jgi:rRNA processing protein Gar1
MEDIFHIKFIIINKEPKQLFTLGTKVKLVKNGKIGLIVNVSGPNAQLEMNDYSYETISDKSEIDATYLDDRSNVSYSYSEINNKQSEDGSLSKKAEDVSIYAFILYSGSNHYEALYLQSERSGGQNRYAFQFSQIPSYIKYLIFLDCYLFVNDAEKQNTPFAKITEFGKELSSLYSIVNEKRNDKMKTINPGKKMQYGGAREDAQFKNLATKYMQDSPLFSYYDSKLGYYIVVDLELYPGDSISTTEGIVLSCNSRYQKIWSSLAEMVGQPFQTAELYVENDKPVEKEKRGGTKRTKSRLFHKTRKNHSG